MLHLRPASQWTIPVLRTQAATGRGIEAVAAAVAAHHDFLATDAGRAGRVEQRRESELLDILGEELRRRVEHGLGQSDDGTAELLDAVRAGRVDPYTAALQILEERAALTQLLKRR